MADYVDEGLKKFGVSISRPMLATVCIIAGIVVILLPSLLVWIVGLFLIVQGALVLTDQFEQERRAIPATTTKGVRCRTCGEMNVADAAYCTKCGKELLQMEQVVTARPQEATQPAIQ